MIFMFCRPPVHGVLGQTFRSDDDRHDRAMKFQELNRKFGRNFVADAAEGDGFLDGLPSNYVTSGLLKADRTFATYTHASPSEMAVGSV